MFCSKCGKKITNVDKFCGSCGVLLHAENDHAEQASTATHQLPVFGNVKSKWWGGLATLATIRTLPKPYDWLYGNNTLMVFENHFVLIPGAEKRSGLANTMTSGIVPAVGLLFGAARIIKDKISNNAASLTASELTQQFCAGELVWCRKDDAEIWALKGKRFLGIGQDSAAQNMLSCKFNSLNGVLNVLFPLDERNAQESMLGDPFASLGCKIIVKANGLTIIEVQEAFKGFYKDLIVNT